MNAIIQCRNPGCCFFKMGNLWVLLLFFNIYFSTGDEIKHTQLSQNQGQSEQTVTYLLWSRNKLSYMSVRHDSLTPVLLCGLRTFSMSERDIHYNSKQNQSEDQDSMLSCYSFEKYQFLFTITFPILGSFPLSSTLSHLQVMRVAEINSFQDNLGPRRAQLQGKRTGRLWLLLLDVKITLQFVIQADVKMVSP